MSHYTSQDDKTFANRLTFDFVAQLEERIATTNITQAEIAKKLKVSEGTVSQVLNMYRSNWNLETYVKYARAAGMKVALVAYDDHDPTNQNGPVGPEIFAQSWEKLGRPRDVWSVNEASYSTTPHYCGAVPEWLANSVTTSTARNNSSQFPYIHNFSQFEELSNYQFKELSNKVIFSDARI